MEKDGKRNNHAKEYNNNGILIFEGEYLNGEKNGQGKEYYDNGKLLFEGEYHKQLKLFYTLNFLKYLYTNWFDYKIIYRVIFLILRGKI